MKYFKIISLALVLALSGAGLADDDVQVNYKVAIAHDDGDGEIQLDFDSDSMDFDLQDMQEGESRSFVDKAGRNILITRNAESYSFNVDGKIIDMPLFDEPHGTVWVDGSHDENVEVHVMQGHSAMPVSSMAVRTGDVDGITILSGQPIDDATQEGIKSLLLSAGHTDDVRFIDVGSAHDGSHAVNVVKKVEIIQ